MLERFTHAMRSAGTIQVTNVDVRWKTNGLASSVFSNSNAANASLTAPDTPHDSLGRELQRQRRVLDGQLHTSTHLGRPKP